MPDSSNFLNELDRLDQGIDQLLQKLNSRVEIKELEARVKYWRDQARQTAGIAILLFAMCFVCFLLGAYGGATREHLRQRERSDVQHESVGDESPRDQRPQNTER